MTETIQRAARALCQKRCVRGEIFGEPCIDPETLLKAPCQANDAQLILTAGIWDGAKAVIETLLDPSEEAVEAAARGAWEFDLPEDQVGWDELNDNTKEVYRIDARACIRAYVEKVLGR